MSAHATIAVIVFLLTYVFIVSEKIHRTIIAMAGAVLMVALGILTQEKALHHIDFNTLGLLIGMMIIVAIASQTGVFSYMAIKAAQSGKGNPLLILVYLGLITAFTSAFLDNVTTVLLMAPVTIHIARKLGVTPVPYLISETLASNIGGTATLIGDPPNLMIGSAVKELTFNDFVINLAPICVLILAVTLWILTLIYRKSLRTSLDRQESIMKLNAASEITDKALLIKTGIVTCLTILGFFLHELLHLDTATIAIAGAFLLLLLTGESHLEKSLHKVEWTTIFFFIGLFVVVGGLVETGVISAIAESIIHLTGGQPLFTASLVLWFSAIASAFVDNIPLVATLIPMIQDFGTMGLTNLDPFWWSLALGACLGGNGTIIGASANVIIAGIAAKEGEPISFLGFMKIAFPLMLVSIAMCQIYVYVRYFL